jgi:hypothetical protein
MLVTKSINIPTTSTPLDPGRPGRTSVRVQNPDVANPIVIAFGGQDAVLSPPNGFVIGPGEFLEIKDPNVGGPITGIAGTGAVDAVLGLT